MNPAVTFGYQSTHRVTPGRKSSLLAQRSRALGVVLRVELMIAVILSQSTVFLFVFFLIQGQSHGEM